MKLSDILKDSNYSLSQFDSEKIELLEDKIKEFVDTASYKVISKVVERSLILLIIS